MPISSNNSRLTHEIYKPPPKSLEQLRLEENPYNGSISRNLSFGSRGRSNMITPTGSPIVREKHLHQLPNRKTAVVEPVKDAQKNQANSGTLLKNDVKGSENIIKSGGGTGGKATGGFGKSRSAFTSEAGKGAEYCCMLNGLYCSRCCWLIFLLGLLLGALIAGLITGLILGTQLEGALLAAATVTTPTAPVGCFQSPCPSAEATCGYSDNNTVINCTCEPIDGEAVSSAEVTAQSYTCTLSNITSTMIPATGTLP